MSFSVRRVEDPTIYVRKSKPDIIGLANAWDNVADFKDALSRLEENITAADKWQKPSKSSRKGPVLREISSETQHLGKVTRFQLVGDNPSNYKSHTKYPATTTSEFKTKRIAATKQAIPVSEAGCINSDVYSHIAKDGPTTVRSVYSPTRYTFTSNTSKSTSQPAVVAHEDRGSLFKTATSESPPTVVAEATDDKKESSYVNTTANTSGGSQQFTFSTSPTFRGKAVLAKNEAALQRIKEKVQKQRTMLTKTNEEVDEVQGDRNLHNSRDQIVLSNEAEEGVAINHVPMKRIVGSNVLTSVPTYKGFSAVSQKTKKPEAVMHRKVLPSKPSSREASKERQKSAKPEPKPKKGGKMNRIVGTKCPKEVISTTSWREGHAAVKKVLGKKKTKPPTIAASKAPEKSDTTYSVPSPVSQDGPSLEARLSDSDEKREEIRVSEERVEKVSRVVPQDDKTSDFAALSQENNNEYKKETLSTEAKSMLDDLAQSSSESESEVKEAPKLPLIAQSKKSTKVKRAKVSEKQVIEDKQVKEKSRHYDQSEVQKYMAQQLAERKKKLRQEKLQKKKNQEEKQRRLQDLYARQKKSFTKKDKRFGQTFSFISQEVRVPEHVYVTDDKTDDANEPYVDDDVKNTLTTGTNESDKENTDVSDFERSAGSLSPEHPVDERQFQNGSSPGRVAVVEKLGSPERESRDISSNRVVQDDTVMPLDRRAQRLTALQATAIALQQRLQSQALRLTGEQPSTTQPPPASARTIVDAKYEMTEFQGTLPGVTNIRKQADDNEKESTRVDAATKIQAAYRGHFVRKSKKWRDANAASRGDELTKNVVSVRGYGHVVPRGEENETDEDDLEFRPLRSSPSPDQHWEAGVKFTYRPERRRFEDLVDHPPRFTIPPRRLEPKGDRYSVMNVFARRHPTLQIEDIANDQPGSETASLLDVTAISARKNGNELYEDDFTDEDVATSSVLTEASSEKESATESKLGTYSESFESDGERDGEGRGTVPRVSRTDEDFHMKSSGQTPPGLTTADLVDEHRRPEGENLGICPVMASTMHPQYQANTPSNRVETEQFQPESSSSLSEDSEHVYRPLFVRPPDRAGGSRLSPNSLQRKFTAEINFLENVEDSVRQLNDIERTKALSLAQQETVSVAQILKAKEQSHKHGLYNLQRKAKEEANQAAKDLEKTREAAAKAAASAEGKLNEIQQEAMKTNMETSRKYVEEASKMASSVVSNATQHLTEFCKNMTATTSAAVQDLHKTTRPTTILVDRATSYSEQHDGTSSSKSDDQTKSPGTSRRQHKRYSSDGFESDQSLTNVNDESDIRTEPTRTGSSVESILEDVPDKSASEEDTTLNDESPSEIRSEILTEKSKKTENDRASVSSLDYSSQFEDSSHIPTDDEIDLHYLLPSKKDENSIRRFKDDSFDSVKSKEKSSRSPFEGEDSFGKFTMDMIHEYMREEEVRTKHQEAILRLREKSLKEKTKAELQWLKQLKKQSCDKKSDDVMPSIKQRVRGIRMNHKAETEEIKFLKAANKAARVQRRFMIYQQQEIRRLHQATVSLRQKVEGNETKKKKPPTLDHSRTSSPLAKTRTSSQASPAVEVSDNDRINKSADTTTSSSISEHISGKQSVTQESPNATDSPFPSYSSPSAAREQAVVPTGEEDVPATNLLSFINIGKPDSKKSGDELLKIHKMLLERQRKLVKDECDVNSMLQKVTEMINNQRNGVGTRSSHDNNLSVPGADKKSKADDSKVTRDRRSPVLDESIDEELPSLDKTITGEEITPEKSASDKYENATFESESTPSRKMSSRVDGKVSKLSQRDFSGSSANEVDESLIEEVLDDSPALSSIGQRKSASGDEGSRHGSVISRRGSQKSSDPHSRSPRSLDSSTSVVEEFKKSSRSESVVSEDLPEASPDRASVPEEFDHSYSDVSAGSILEDVPSSVGTTPEKETELSRGSADKQSARSYSIPEDLPTPEKATPRSYTEPRTDDIRSVAEHVPTADEGSPASVDDGYKYSYTEPRTATSVHDSSRSRSGTEHSYTEPRSAASTADDSRSIPEDLPSDTEEHGCVVEEIEQVAHRKDSETVADEYTEPRSQSSVSKKLESVGEDLSKSREPTPKSEEGEISHRSYTEPQSESEQKSISDKSANETSASISEKLESVSEDLSKSKEPTPKSEEGEISHRSYTEPQSESEQKSINDKSAKEASASIFEKLESVSEELSKSKEPTPKSEEGEISHRSYTEPQSESEQKSTSDKSAKEASASISEKLESVSEELSKSKEPTPKSEEGEISHRSYTEPQSESEQKSISDKSANEASASISEKLESVSEELSKSKEPTPKSEEGEISHRSYTEPQSESEQKSTSDKSAKEASASISKKLESVSKELLKSKESTPKSEEGEISHRSYTEPQSESQQKSINDKSVNEASASISEKLESVSRDLLKPKEPTPKSEENISHRSYTEPKSGSGKQSISGKSAANDGKVDSWISYSDPFATSEEPSTEDKFDSKAASSRSLSGRKSIEKVEVVSQKNGETAARATQDQDEPKSASRESSRSSKGKEQVTKPKDSTESDISEILEELSVASLTHESSEGQKATFFTEVKEPSQGSAPITDDISRKSSKAKISEGNEVRSFRVDSDTSATSSRKPKNASQTPSGSSGNLDDLSIGSLLGDSSGKLSSDKAKKPFENKQSDDKRVLSKVSEISEPPSAAEEASKRSKSIDKVSEKRVSSRHSGLDERDVEKEDTQSDISDLLSDQLYIPSFLDSAAKKSTPRSEKTQTWTKPAISIHTPREDNIVDVTDDDISELDLGEETFTPRSGRPLEDTSSRAKSTPRAESGRITDLQVDDISEIEPCEETITPRERPIPDEDVRDSKSSRVLVSQEKVEHVPDRLEIPAKESTSDDKDVAYDGKGLQGGKVTVVEKASLGSISEASSIVEDVASEVEDSEKSEELSNKEQGVLFFGDKAEQDDVADMEKTGFADSEQSAEVEKAKTAEIKNAKSAEIEKAKSAEIEKAKSAEIEKAKSAEIEKVKSAEIKKAKSAEVEKVKSAEIEKAKSAEIEKAKSAEIEKAKSAEIEKAKSAEVEKAKSAEIEKAKSAEIEKAKSAEIEKAKSAEAEKAKSAEVEESKSVDSEKAESVYSDDFTASSEEKDDSAIVEETTPAHKPELPPAMTLSSDVELLDTITAMLFQRIVDDTVGCMSGAKSSKSAKFDINPPEVEAGMPEVDNVVEVATKTRRKSIEEEIEEDMRQRGELCELTDDIFDEIMDDSFEEKKSRKKSKPPAAKKAKPVEEKFVDVGVKQPEAVVNNDKPAEHDSIPVKLETDESRSTEKTSFGEQVEEKSVDVVERQLKTINKPAKLEPIPKKLEPIKKKSHKKTSLAKPAQEKSEKAERQQTETVINQEPSKLQPISKKLEPTENEASEKVTTEKRIEEKSVDKQQVEREAGEEKVVEKKPAETSKDDVQVDSITKELLADAIMQMIAVKKRKSEMAEKASPTPPVLPKSPPEKRTAHAIAPRLSPEQEDKAVDQALLIAKSNQDLDKDALKAMDDDIEGILGPLGDDQDGEEGDFPVNRVAEATEPEEGSAREEDSAPIFAVPHNVPELTAIVNDALDELLEHRRRGLPLSRCEAPAAFLTGAPTSETDGSGSNSIRSYRRLVYDLTKEVLRDIVSPEGDEANRPPWSKPKTAGKLSRSFKRWTGDAEMRGSVLQRVKDLIGLGAPRTTMQTLQRKTPVRGNKKDDVDAILIEELREEEPQWTNYDDDETTVKFQVADSILDMLIDDTVRVFNCIETKRNVSKDGVVV